MAQPPAVFRAALGPLSCPRSLRRPRQAWRISRGASLLLRESRGAWPPCRRVPIATAWGFFLVARARSCAPRRACRPPTTSLLLQCPTLITRVFVFHASRRTGTRRIRLERDASLHRCRCGYDRPPARPRREPCRTPNYVSYSRQRRRPSPVVVAAVSLNNLNRGHNSIRKSDRPHA